MPAGLGRARVAANGASRGMMEWTRLGGVAVGGRVLDTDLAKVARGLGERMRSGVADAAERIYYAISTGTRIIKCPAEGATAEIDEWLAGLHMIKPAEASWPSADVGEDGGINPGTPIALFAYGSQEVSQCGGSSDEDGVPDEETRLLPVDPMLTPDATLEDLWNLHAGNRGAIDPDTMAYASPALSAADASAGVRYASTGYYGNRYGGWQPIAEFGDPDWCDDGLAGVRRIFRFTRLSDGHVVEYQDGNCAEPQVGGTYVLEYEEYYLVLVRTAPETYEVTRYEKSEWIEGPYNRGGALSRRSSNPYAWIEHNFVREFRGSLSQQAVKIDAEFNGVAFERFQTTQYFVAPAIGTTIGEEIAEDNPTFTLASVLDPADGVYKIADGTYGIHDKSGTTGHTIAEGFVFSGAFVKATGLVGQAQVEILCSGSVALQASLDAEVSGGTMAIAMMTAPMRAQPLQVRVYGTAVFSSAAGKIEVRGLEQIEMLPRHQKDDYVWLRLATSSSATPDGVGTMEEDARSVSDIYFATGGIVNINGLSGAYRPSAINQSAPVDAWRRFSQCVRVIPGANIAGYAIEGGKSVVWFNRKRTLEGVEVDLFEGVGPSLDAIESGEIEEDIEYIVRTAAVTYNGVEYGVGERFTGAAGHEEFSGTGQVYEYDGIRSEAPARGFTNEWLANAYLKVGTSEGLLFNFEDYATKYAWLNRCLFDMNGLSLMLDGPEFLQHIAYGQDPPLSPEAVSALNYTRKFNEELSDPDWQTKFFKSCQVHAPWPEMESAVMDGDELKVTFKTRFQYCDTGAPSTLDRDVSGWNETDLTNEPYRTLENGIRQHLFYQHDGSTCEWKIGDASTRSTMYIGDTKGTVLGEDVDGACHPHMILVKLPEVPHIDDNDRADAADTPFWHDQITRMWFYAMAMVEGYVDKTRTDAAIEESLCSYGGDWIMEYTVENACMEAFGRPYPTPLPTAMVPHNPRGFGPLPASKGYAETFNQLVEFINLMYRVRLDMGVNIESRYIIYSDDRPAVPDWPVPPGCTPSGGQAAVWEEPREVTQAVIPFGPGTGGEDPPYWSEWDLAASLAGSTSAQIVPDDCDDSDPENPGYILRVGREVLEFRAVPITDNQWLAVPEALRDLVSDQSLEFAAYVQDDRTPCTVTKVYSSDDASHCAESPLPSFWDPSAGYGFEVLLETATETKCMLLSAGVIDLGAPGFPDGDGETRLCQFAVCRVVSHGEEGLGPVRTQTIQPQQNASAVVVVIPLVDEE